MWLLCQVQSQVKTVQKLGFPLDPPLLSPPLPILVCQGLVMEELWFLAEIIKGNEFVSQTFSLLIPKSRL